MPTLVLYEIWCKIDYQTFFAIPAKSSHMDVGLLLDPREDLDELLGIGQQLVAEKMGFA